MVEPQPLSSMETAERTASVDRDVANPPDHGTDRMNGNGGGTHPQNASPEGPGFFQAMKPVLQGIEALARAQFEQADVLERVQKAMLGQEAVPRMLSETKAALDQKNSINRSMFEALHAELKSYKDGFLLESMLKPVIRDIILLYDDITEIHRQLSIALTSHEKRGQLSGGELILFESVVSPMSRLEHNRDAILEVLERLDVSRIPSNTGKLDKRSQRAVSVELVEDPEQDQQVVKVVKCGFQWRERMIRPEEVVIKKWQEGYLAALNAAAEKS
jgi:molecular chaperone GrpE (heat shock protein)